MKVALLAQSIEDLGAEILNITKKNTFGGGNVYQIDIAEPASANPAKIEHSEVKTLPPADIFTTDVF